MIQKGKPGVLIYKIKYKLEIILTIYSLKDTDRSKLTKITCLRKGVDLLCHCSPICFLLIITMCSGCRSNNNDNDNDNNKLFTIMPSSRTGIHFSNDVKYSAAQNPYTNHGFYNGGGIAVGDINNDGLPDLFFTSNQGQNRLYLNK